MRMAERVRPYLGHERERKRVAAQQVVQVLERGLDVPRIGLERVTIWSAAAIESCRMPLTTAGSPPEPSA